MFFFRGTVALAKNALKFSPKVLSLYFVGLETSRKILAKFPSEFPSPKNLNLTQCKNLMYSKKGGVYKLHARWFINRTPGEFINRGLCVKFKGLLCGDPTERGESLILNFWPPGSL